MLEGHEHDILKYIGTPLMIGGSIVTYKTDSTKAAYVALIGATMNLSWAAVDILKYSNDKKEKW